MEPQEIVFCKGGGCTAKLGPGILAKVLNNLPKIYDPNLLIGFDGSDDAAVYKSRHWIFSRLWWKILIFSVRSQQPML